jgi:UDP-N-acetylglucosamine 4-epimerase
MKLKEVESKLTKNPKCWLVTGVAGFIGSNILQYLLELGQKVVGLDNFSTGYQHNLDDVKRLVGEDVFKNFAFIKGDIADAKACAAACRGVDLVLHQAALGSVPRSIEDPLTTDTVNVHGSIALFLAARDAGIKRIVYASSSSVYGDNDAKIKVEERLGRPLSPYAVSKLADELYAETFRDLYQLELVGLRYFNVFGGRQDPDGAYAAVVPKWIDALLNGEQCIIYGDGLTSRDFCYIKNVIQANILAATSEKAEFPVYNIACGASTTLLELHKALVEGVKSVGRSVTNVNPIMKEFRAGDVRASLASISRAEQYLGYQSTHNVKEGLKETVQWYKNKVI